ncbi:MAG: hypothetical protein CSA26_06125 [Desulfobacterales bacterium]|nr:MAG: hypothetical protein CSA26_06125 [Desulfobacterales bacterium]
MSEEKKPFFGFIRTKIRNKILAVLLGGWLGTLLVAAIALITMSVAKKSLDELINHHGLVVALANEAQRELLFSLEQGQKYQLNNKRIGFQNARDEYLDKFQSHVNNVATILKDMHNVTRKYHGHMPEAHTLEKDHDTEPDNKPAPGHGHHKVILDRMNIASTQLRTYIDTFVKIVDLSEKHGYKDYGLVGLMRNYAHEIEYQVGNMGDPEVMKTVLSIRRHEKDYLLRTKRIYSNKLRKSVDTLKRQIEQSRLNRGTKQNIIYLANQYLEKFDSLIAVQREIANQGRINRATVNLMLPTMVSIVEVGTEEQKNAIAKVNRQNRLVFIIVVATTAITLLVGFIAAFFFSRHITRQTDNINDLFGEIGIGNFNARAEVMTSDELGEMAESLNAMLDNTLTLIQSRDERDAIQESIMKLLMEISDLADGDLTARAEVTEEITGAIADSFNSMAEQLSRVVQDVKDASAQVGSSSDDVNQVTRRLSEASEEQAGKIGEAIAAIEEMARSIRQVSENASQSADVSSLALASARDGSDSVRKTNEAMAAIKENMRGTARTIKRLGESSQEIGNIVSLINDIADRTSILALNASIQAASAGEAGRGFAVVAEEVQRLAERSTESTKQIETLISGIQGEISEAGTSMEKSIQYVVDGTELADQAHDKLEEIETVSNQLAGIIQGISERARQQSTESEMITSMMQEVGVLTEQTTSATRETAASMEKITTTSKRLEESIAVFKVETTAEEQQEDETPAESLTQK